MGWPKGVPRKPKVQPLITEVPYLAPKEELTKAIPEEGAIVSEKTVDEVMSTAMSYPSMEPSLISKEADPWTSYKVDEHKWAYRGIAKRENLLRQREASGWKLVEGAPVLGDVVLAKMPRELANIRKKQQEDMTKRQSQAAKEQFKEAASQSGVRTFEDK